MRIIGVTGGIGSGKSTVVSILKRDGAFVVDADKIAHRIIRKGQEAYGGIVEHFGRGILDKDGEIDRRLLGQIVFSDPEELKVLNQITHPYISSEIRKIVKEKRDEGTVELLVLDVPLPVREGFLDMADEVWTVVSGREVRLERIMGRNRLSREEAEARIDAQVSDDEYIETADIVIQNNGMKKDLEEKVKMLLNHVRRLT